MTPKMTLVLPIYNVEDYLPQCLESVIHQTLDEIQIICVNDGSTDHSRSILSEYAKRDDRIEIIDQENQGAGTARNAAYPHIKGEFTYFADPDDWLELNLCEKTFCAAKRKRSDAVYFQHHVINEGKKSYYFHQMTRKTHTEKRDFGCFTSAWKKIWKTDFLLKNDIRFCEGRRPNNDVIQNWKGIILAKEILFIPDFLYHHRIRSGSYQQTIDKCHMIIIESCKKIENFLDSVGLFDEYKMSFIPFKLRAMYSKIWRVPIETRNTMAHKIALSLTPRDHVFILKYGEHYCGWCYTFYKNLIDKQQ